MENKQKGWNPSIEIKNEKQIKVWIVVVVLTYCLYYLYDITEPIPSLWMTRFANLGISIICLLPALIAYKTVGIYREKKEKDVLWQWLWVLVLMALCFVWRYTLEGLPEQIGYAFRGMPAKEQIKLLLWMVFYSGFVGATEEFVYRIYIQGELSEILGKVKWIAPIIGGILFAVAHYPQGGWLMTRYNIGIGLILGFAYQYSSKCNYKTLVTTHALLDFLIFVFGL